LLKTLFRSGDNLARPIVSSNWQAALDICDTPLDGANQLGITLVVPVHHAEDILNAGFRRSAISDPQDQPHRRILKDISSTIGRVIVNKISSQSVSWSDA
jgi:hypothetical protein